MLVDKILCEKNHTHNKHQMLKSVKSVRKIKFYATFYPWERLFFVRLFQSLRIALFVHSLSGQIEFLYSNAPRITSGLTSRMVVCCKCNRSGHCRNCACVKAGKTCQSCLPSRLIQCTNINPQSTNVAQNDAHQDVPTNSSL